MKLIATKRLYYPSGPSGKEYAPGDAFTALSERDAKALKLVGKAKDAPGPTQRRKIVDLPPAAMKAQSEIVSLLSGKLGPNGEQEATLRLEPEPEVPVPGRSFYQRRDMKAED